MIDTAPSPRRARPAAADDDSRRVVGSARDRPMRSRPGVSDEPTALWGDEPRSPSLACQSRPEVFFAESPRAVEVAKALCADCPARAQCLAGARARREPWGVWGGELFKDGLVIARKRPRGRPRKTAA
jgi:WhiB family transcriptional regulator, redox-sensing transcriptional regulator